MSKPSIIILTGILVFLVPFTGFPGQWENTFLIIAGIIITISGALIKRESSSSETSHIQKSSGIGVADSSTDSLQK